LYEIKTVDGMLNSVGGGRCVDVLIFESNDELFTYIRKTVMSGVWITENGLVFVKTSNEPK